MNSAYSKPNICTGEKGRVIWHLFNVNITYFQVEPIWLNADLWGER